MSDETDATAANASLALHEEQISVVRRRVEGDTIRVATVTRTIENHVTEELSHERIEIEHISIGRHIDAMPSVREEGDITIIPVVEEILFIEKRLVLKEEVHIRRVRVPDVHREVVTLRKQDAVVERTKPGEMRRDSRELASIPKQQAVKE